MIEAPIRVVAAIIETDGRVLVARRAFEKRHGGLWEFPGGKCEPDESDEDALARELIEELGVELTHAGVPLASLRDPASPFEIVFIPVDIRGEPECLEHLEIRWVSIADLEMLPLAPTDRRFVEWQCLGNLRRSARD